MVGWLISALDNSHDRSAFACGQPSLDQFLKQYAGQNQNKDLSRTFVLTHEGEARVFGYYSLTASQIDRASLPAQLRKGLANYPVPVVRLARLALDETVKKTGLGRHMLWDALNRCVSASTSVGMFAVAVDAINEEAVAFYLHHGFVPLDDQPLCLIITLKTVRQLFKK